jgi:outer membrane receptor protein involved in Fe transport
MNRLTLLMLLGSALTLTGYTAISSAQESEEDESKYIEEIIVTGERGEIRTIDRAMTVTGFNANLIQKLGIQNTNDMEVLVPGMQIGNRTQGGGKNEDGHIVMRGLANDRSVNFFQDTGVAVYIDGVYSDQSYGLDQGAMFDVERVEIARGPQGTTGGKAAISGAVSFITTKPTAEWDLKASAEFTDQATRQANLAFGGPIGDSNFSYRLGLSRMTGDGLIKNVGSGPDGGIPDQLIYSPQLRFTNDRWDITARYSKLTDEGTPRISLIIGARNAEEQFLLDNFGNPRCEFDPETQATTRTCITDAAGNPIYLINPSFGLGQNPAVANCPGFNLDGTRDPGTPVVCDGNDLTLAIEQNGPILQRNSQEAMTLEAHYTLNDSHELIYKFGNRDTRQKNRADIDLTNRQGGGVCSAIHPRVLSGELVEGQTHPRCALDGRGNGAYADRMNDYHFTSDQDSHELSLVSNNDGPFNYTFGYTFIDGEEPYIYSERFNGVETGNNNNNIPVFYQDNSALCEASLEERHPGLLWKDAKDPSKAANSNSANKWGCHGSAPADAWSDVTNSGSHVAGDGAFQFFYGNVAYTSQAIYGNAEYVLNDEWKVFGGVRYNDDHKEHNQNDFSGIRPVTDADGEVIYFETFALLRNKHMNYRCCLQGGVTDPSTGEVVPPDRTFLDSKRRTWRETTWNIGAEYTPSDTMMWYARISKGYRPGGFRGFAQGLGEGWDAEEMINYEGGLKGLFADGAVQLELSAYHQDFSAHWTQHGRLRRPEEYGVPPNPDRLWIGESVVLDGTTISGIEFQGAWQINDMFTLRGFYELINSKHAPYSSIYCCNPEGFLSEASTITVTGPDGTEHVLNNTGVRDFTGNQLRNSPKHKFSATLTYGVPIASEWGSLDVLTTVSWRDKMYMDEAELDIYSVPDYTRWDLRANWISPSGIYSISGWATNVLDQIAVQSYVQREGNGVTAPVTGTVTDERRIGITFNYQL